MRSSTTSEEPSDQSNKDNGYVISETNYLNNARHLLMDQTRCYKFLVEPVRNFLFSSPLFFDEMGEVVNVNVCVCVVF